MKFGATSSLSRGMLRIVRIIDISCFNKRASHLTHSGGILIVQRFTGFGAGLILVIGSVSKDGPFSFE